MAKFVRKGKDGGMPAISTASLPDIVFMILMFFMVSVSMRKTDRMVQGRASSPNPRGTRHQRRYPYSQP